MPYTGSGVLGSALSMDKIRSKQVWLSLGLPTPRYVRLARAATTYTRAARELGLAGDREAVVRRLERRRHRACSPTPISTTPSRWPTQYPGELLMEQLIEGDELTVGILGDVALPSIRIVPKGQWYDYHAKYVAEDTQYLCPGLDGDAEDEIRAPRAARVRRARLRRLGPRRRDARRAAAHSSCSRSTPRRA